MKRVYEVIVETDRETATRIYLVTKPNIKEAADAGMRAYRKDDRLYGVARVSGVKELGRVS